MIHPWWCAGGAACGLGEHRSPPRRLDMPWGGLVVTRVRGHRQPSSHLEVRLSVKLPVDEDEARATAEQLAGELVAAVEAVRAGRVDAIR